MCFDCCVLQTALQFPRMVLYHLVFTEVFPEGHLSFSVVYFIIYAAILFIKHYGSRLLSSLRRIDAVTIKCYTAKCRPRMEYVGMTGSRDHQGMIQKPV